MAITTTTLVRQVTGGKLTVAKIDNDDLNEIILQATAKINNEINVEVREEEVKLIDSWRKNEISDGSSTTFFVRNGVTNYLADMNDDGEVTIADVKVYKLDSDDVRTELTVSAIDVQDGSFTLSETPGTDAAKLFVTYNYSYYDITIPDRLVQLLATYLSAAWGYTSVEHGLSGSTKFGNITLSKPQMGTSSAQYLTRYEELLKRVMIPSNKARIKVSKYLI